MVVYSAARIASPHLYCEISYGECKWCWESNLYAGTFDKASEQKTGYKLPVPCVAVADMTRIIMSEEVQSSVNAPKTDHLKPKNRALKPNPLVNKDAMLELDPYAKEAAVVLGGTVSALDLTLVLLSSDSLYVKNPGNQILFDVL